MTPAKFFFIVAAVSAVVLVASLIGLAFQSEHRRQWILPLVISSVVELVVPHVPAIYDWMGWEGFGIKYSLDRDASKYLEWKGDTVHMREDPAALKPPLGWAIYVGDHKEGRGSRAVEPGQPFPVEPGDNEVWYWFQQDREHQDGKLRNATPARPFTR